jgi:hypothetical protein
VLEHLVQCVRQPQLRLTRGGVAETKVSEHVSRAPGDRFYSLDASTSDNASGGKEARPQAPQR